MNNLFLKTNDDEMHAELMRTMSKTCGPVINLNNPAESALVKLLRGPCNGTLRMPLGACDDAGNGNCVPEDYIMAIQQWIANGAPKQ